MIHPILLLMPLVNRQKVFYNGLKNSKGAETMKDNERELIDIIRESEDPAKVGEYFFSLFSDYLRTHGPYQGTPSADPRESV